MALVLLGLCLVPGVGLNVNGEPYAQATLRSGDVIELGHVHVRFAAAGEKVKLSSGAAGLSKGRGRTGLVVSLLVVAVAVAAVTAGLPRSGSLAGLLLLPLAVPLLIFGAANALLLEAAISLLLTAGAPFVAGAAIRAGRT